MADIRLIVRPTLAGFGKIVGVNPPPCYEPTPPHAVVIVTADYASLFSTQVGDEVCYARVGDTYMTVVPDTSGT